MNQTKYFLLLFFLNTKKNKLQIFKNILFTYTNQLEFYIQIYFLIYDIHPLFKQRQQIFQEKIDYFKHYLDSKGSELAKTSELLCFYALPYVQKPLQHVGFKQLFEKKWVQDLLTKLKERLDAAIKQADTQTVLEQMYEYYKQKNNNQNQPIQVKIVQNNNSVSYVQQDTSQFLGENSYMNDNLRNNTQYLTIIQELNYKYNNLHKIYLQAQEQAKQTIMDSHQKWFKIGQDLVSLSKELIILSEKKDIQSEQYQNIMEGFKKKLVKYEHFLNSNIDDLIHQSQDISLFNNQMSILDNEQINNNQIFQKQQELVQQKEYIIQQQSNQQQYQNQQQQIQLQQQQKQQQICQIQYLPLDFYKIKNIIKLNNNDQLSINILQSLRWRITKTKNGLMRRVVVISYTINDILGGKNNDIILQQSIFYSQNVKIIEYGLRLTNAIASDFQGRTYLVECPNLIKILIRILKNENDDNCTRRNALGALQKLSLRRTCQLIMIENDVIEWIIKKLKYDKNLLSEYSYEYATALFMNLSLRTLGKDKCQQNSVEVLQVLYSLLEHNSQQVRTFVNGTLYSLLSRSVLKEQAKKLNFLQFLNYLKLNSNEIFYKQIQYIIDQLQSDDYNEENSISDQEEENNEDDFENEEIDEEVDGQKNEEDEEDDEKTNKLILIIQLEKIFFYKILSQEVKKLQNKINKQEMQQMKIKRLI
ncbi:hypothetical protein IMG5_153370 [Ichthyophthirius multifiliis]|uniref:Armadillo-type fold n=1 Tax=Ichthyophthirius multifiliis TaxID=5932 RepID=G0QYZ4_ICHMU|nr:hypothetical protein IMG5_153370 [Ichthyophthirius multifiliis]EGR29565.1 hypothetical protein IMG5_153370 [Ichthyophthirius multifiliis]|eukprot:XP_004030801.1 hypothetical protein IMG5_153370 [Ichthyophthirius multifiliis]